MNFVFSAARVKRNLTPKRRVLRPVDKKAFTKWKSRLSDSSKDPVFLAVPFMLVVECWALIRSYYGTNKRAVFEIARLEFGRWWHCDVWFTFLLWITDSVGWTKVYKIPETDEIRPHFQRHGYKCSGSPNCDNMYCIDESLPKWFKFITRWDNN